MKAGGYRLCWWCNRQFQGPFHRVCEVNGNDVRVHAACLGEMVKAGADVSLIRCGNGCECRQPIDVIPEEGE